MAVIGQPGHAVFVWTTPCEPTHPLPPRHRIGNFNMAVIGLAWWLAMAILFSVWADESNRAGNPSESPAMGALGRLCSASARRLRPRRDALLVQGCWARP